MQKHKDVWREVAASSCGLVHTFTARQGCQLHTRAAADKHHSLELSFKEAPTAAPVSIKAAFYPKSAISECPSRYLQEAGAHEHSVC